MEHITPGLGTMPHSPPFRVLRLIMAAGAAAAGLCLILALTALATSFGDAKIGDAGNYTTGGMGPGKSQQSDLNRSAGSAHRGGHHPQHPGRHGTRSPVSGRSRSGSPRPGGSHRPTPTPTPTQTHQPSPAPTQSPTASPSGGPQPGSTVEAYQGTASATEGPFHIGQPGNWGVSWAFQCPAGRSEDFSVTETAGRSGRPLPGGLQIDTSGPSGSGLAWQSADVGSHFLQVTSGCSWTVNVVLPKTD